MLPLAVPAPVLLAHPLPVALPEPVAEAQMDCVAPVEGVGGATDSVAATEALTLKDAEVLLLIERDRLMGRGVGYVDAHLLAFARLSHCRLWTQDRRLAAVAQEKGLGGRQPERE